MFPLSRSRTDLAFTGEVVSRQGCGGPLTVGLPKGQAVEDWHTAEEGVGHETGCVNSQGGMFSSSLEGVKGRTLSSVRDN